MHNDARNALHPSMSSRYGTYSFSILPATAGNLATAATLGDDSSSVDALNLDNNRPSPQWGSLSVSLLCDLSRHLLYNLQQEQVKSLKLHLQRTAGTRPLPALLPPSPAHVPAVGYLTTRIQRPLTQPFLARNVQPSA